MGSLIHLTMLIACLLLSVCGISQPREKEVDIQDVKAFDSPNIETLLKKLPFVADRPIARETRYIYSSVLELKKKVFDPFYVTNEDRGYVRKTTPGTSWNDIADVQLESISKSGREWIKKNESNWSATEMEGYMAFQQSMENSISTMQTYFAAMDALSALAYSWARKDAERLSEWTASVTKCISPEAPEGSILHLDIMRFTKGERFKFHSSNDFIVIATLESFDGKMISSTRAMQMWRNTKKKIVAPENAIPIFEFSAAEEKMDILEPVSKDTFIARHALLINAAVEDLYMRLEALDESGERSQRLE